MADRVAGETGEGRNPIGYLSPSNRPQGKDVIAGEREIARDDKSDRQPEPRERLSLECADDAAELDFAKYVKKRKSRYCDNQQTDRHCDRTQTEFFLNRLRDGAPHIRH